MSTNKKNIIFLYFLNLIIITLSSDIYSQENNTTEFLKFIKNSDFDNAYPLLDDKVQTILTRDNFSKSWNTGFSSLGKMIDFNFKCKEANQVYYYDVQFEKANLILKFNSNTKGRIRNFIVTQNVPCEDNYLLPKYANKKKYLDTIIDVTHLDHKIQASLMEPKSNYEDIVCILAPGSGPQDMDSSIGPNKPFKDLAIGLAVNNISSIRYSKASLNLNKETSEITIEDEYVNVITSIVTYIKNQDKFKNSIIVLIGHSQGGIITPFITEKLKDIDGGIVMSGSPRKLEDLILEQTIYLTNKSDIISKTKDSIINNIKIKVNNVKNNLDEPISKEDLPLMLPKKYWASLEDYTLVAKKNRKFIRKSETPLHFLWGEKDYQVLKEDFEAYKKLYKNKATYKSYQDLNHIFHKSNGDLLPSEYLIPGNMPEYVINDIVIWLKTLKNGKIK